jgi:hypothetical protein
VQARGRCTDLGKDELTNYMVICRTLPNTDGKRREMCSSWDSLHACMSASLVKKMSKETGRDREKRGRG